MNRMIFAAAAVALMLSWHAPAAAAPGNSFAVRGVRVFTGQRTIPKANVVVRDGRIVSVGNAPVPPGLPIIGGAGRTLLPGLIDSHVHVFPGAQADALRFGVTTELDMFDLQRDFVKWRRQRQSLARTDEADTWGAGVGVTVPGGHPADMAPPGVVPTLAHGQSAKDFVDARVREGSDYIKLFIEDLSEYGGKKRLPTLSRDQVCAVIAAAHRDGRMAIVHISREKDAAEAIMCGADGLAHLFGDVVADRAFISLAKRRGVFFLSTLDVEAGASGWNMSRALMNRPSVKPYLSRTQMQSLGVTFPHLLPKTIGNALASAGLLHRAGVPILAGTDAPNPSTAHGVSLHEELQLLVRAGFTPAQALNAATALPDRIFHLGDRGHVAAGYRADLLLVNGDPTRNIGATLNILRIWKNGYAVERTPPKP